MSGAYYWLKALHIIFVVTWFAGLFYLPRLFVYHADATDDVSNARFKVMERKLLRGIINPSMILAFILGGILLANLDTDAWSEGWLHGKLTFVVILAAYHGWMARWRKDFEADRNVRPAKFYRWMNEVPAVLMMGIVIFVIVRPF